MNKFLDLGKWVVNLEMVELVETYFEPGGEGSAPGFTGMMVLESGKEISLKPDQLVTLLKALQSSEE